MSPVGRLQETFQKAVLAEDLTPGLFSREGGEGVAFVAIGSGVFCHRSPA